MAICVRSGCAACAAASMIEAGAWKETGGAEETVGAAARPEATSAITCVAFAAAIDNSLRPLFSRNLITLFRAVNTSAKKNRRWSRDRLPNARRLACDARAACMFRGCTRLRSTCRKWLETRPIALRASVVHRDRRATRSRAAQVRAARMAMPATPADSSPGSSFFASRQPICAKKFLRAAKENGRPRATVDRAGDVALSVLRLPSRRRTRRRRAIRWPGRVRSSRARTASLRRTRPR